MTQVSGVSARLLDAITVPLLLIVRGERVVFANASAKRLFGDLDEEGEPPTFLGDDDRPLLPDRRPWVRAALGEEIQSEPVRWRSGGRICRGVMAASQADGESVICTLEEVRSEEGDASPTPGRSDLADALEEMEAFVHSVSHDLRAPLRSINGFSSILLEDYGERLDQEGRDLLRRVIAASGRMGSLMDGLLRLSRVSKAPLHREEVNLSELAEEVIEELRLTTGQTATVNIEPDLVVRGDAALLRIVLENLLGNAWKFTGKTPEPCIEFGAKTYAGRRMLCVSDNGAGFDSDQAQKLFRPFERLHSTREFPGTGIGLATVRRAIRRHGGTVWAESSPGKGARFYFELGPL